MVTNPNAWIVRRIQVANGRTSVIVSAANRPSTYTLITSGLIIECRGDVTEPAGRYRRIQLHLASQAANDAKTDLSACL